MPGNIGDRLIITPHNKTLQATEDYYILLQNVKWFILIQLLMC